jgi:hypothetical protein
VNVPRTFTLVRDEDVTGVSGTGVIAHGVEFPDGTVVLRWVGEHASLTVWSSLDHAITVHGHGGRTRFVWATDGLDLPGIRRRLTDTQQAEVEQWADKASVIDRSQLDVGPLLEFAENLGGIDRG